MANCNVHQVVAEDVNGTTLVIPVDTPLVRVNVLVIQLIQMLCYLKIGGNLRNPWVMVLSMSKELIQQTQEPSFQLVLLMLKWEMEQSMLKGLELNLEDVEDVSGMIQKIQVDLHKSPRDLTHQILKPLFLLVHQIYQWVWCNQCEEVRGKS